MSDTLTASDVRERCPRCYGKGLENQDGQPGLLLGALGEYECSVCGGAGTVPVVLYRQIMARVEEKSDVRPTYSPSQPSTVDVLRAELADLQEQRRRHADDCRGVDGRGFRNVLFFEKQESFSRLILSVEQRIAKEETQP